jgi:glycosyltransferase involved in cell wall biosynthesis
MPDRISDGSGRLSASTLKVVVLPRDRNPYQRLLYEQFERFGHPVRYAAQLTRSRTLNLLLLPLELAVWRPRGWRVLHVHWVFGFKLPGSDRFPVLRRLAEAWFAFVLGLSKLLRIRIVWTVHNILPHEPIFHDEVAARRRLARAADLVVVHAADSVRELEAIGARPRRWIVVAQGPQKPGFDPSTLRAPGSGQSVLRLLFFGLILEYKGVEDLLAVMNTLAPSVEARLVVAGECRDEGLRQRLQALARDSSGRVELMLERLPEEQVTPLFAASDAVVLPFRRVTTSSSALLAMGYGRVVVLPRLPAFESLPADAAVFYDGSPDDLRRAISDLAGWPSQRLHDVGARAGAYVRTLSWADSARQIIEAIDSP